MKSEGEILKENQLIRDEMERQRYNFMRNNNNNNNNNNYDANVISTNRSGSVKDLNSSSSSMRDLDQPLSVYLANRELNAAGAAGTMNNKAATRNFS